MLKFRSMVVNAEELKALLKERNERTGPVFKIRNDPRITRIGGFFRKNSPDQLPHWFNTLRDELSEVRPPPPPPHHTPPHKPPHTTPPPLFPPLTFLLT